MGNFNPFPFRHPEIFSGSNGLGVSIADANDYQLITIP